MLNSGLRYARLLAFLLSVFFVAASAHAAPITITGDSRRIAGNADTLAAPNKTYADFASTSPWVVADGTENSTAGGAVHSDATQTSTVDAPILQASGTTHITGNSSTDPNFADGLSYYGIQFTLSDPFTFSWSASLSAAFDPGSGQPAEGRTGAVAFLYDFAAGTYLDRLEVTANAANLFGATAGSDAGLLLPGSYALLGEAFGNGWADASATSFVGNGSFEVALTLTPATATAVPEPATLTLVGCGAVAAVLRRRRSLSDRRQQKCQGV
jgi:hypothetical protein